MKKLFLFIAALFCFQASDASHLAGGGITYEHISDSTYLIKLRRYIDCTQGIPPLYPNSLQCKSTSLNVSRLKSLPLVNRYYLKGTCSGVATICTNPTSAFIGYAVSDYADTMILSSANDWVFLAGSCCRNVAIQNLPPANITYRTTLDNLTVPFNSSVSFPTVNQLFYEINQQYTIAFSPVDPDGDSLDVHLTPASSNFGPNNTYNPSTYIAPHTFSQPFPTSSPIVFNSSTGTMTFTDTMVGTFVVAVEVDEYRNGVLIATTYRDLQLTFIPGSGNNLPVISAPSAANIYTIEACPGYTLNIPLQTSDADVADSTFLLWDTAINAASLTITPTQNEMGVFSWSPSATDIRARPYLVTFYVQDNKCPVYGQQSYTYQIFVNQCTPDSVWAGDANADLICNNYDVLALGIANGSTGPLRPSATINWQAEWCSVWVDTFLSAINYKHADCNGDGTVNSTDLAAVTANYGLIHTKTNKVGQYKTLGFPDLYCDLTNVQAHQGTTVTLPIMLGSSASLMNDFYGISATVELLNAQTSAPIGISKNVSWIGNATNSFSFEKSLAPNKSAFTFVRNNQQNLTAQQGQIGEISFPIDMASSIGSKVIVQFSDIKMIKNTGEEIYDYNVMQDTVTILGPTSVSEFDKTNAINVYPNPAKSVATISIVTDKEQVYQLALYDIVGRVVQQNVFSGSLEKGKHMLELDLSDKAQGEYLLEIQTELGKKIIPVQKR